MVAQQICPPVQVLEPLHFSPTPEQFCVAARHCAPPMPTQQYSPALHVFAPHLIMAPVPPELAPELPLEPELACPDELAGSSEEQACDTVTSNAAPESTRRIERISTAYRVHKEKAPSPCDMGQRPGSQPVKECSDMFFSSFLASGSWGRAHGALVLAAVLSATSLASAAEKGADGEAAKEEDSAQAKTQVRLDADWQDTTLVHHLGTSYGTGYSGGRTVSVAVAHLEKVCRLPCKTSVYTDGEYYVDAPGMRPARLEIPVGARALNLKVKGAPTWPVMLSWSGIYLGVIPAVLGGTFMMLRQKSDDYGFAAPTLVGGLAMIGAGIVGLILSPSTRLESADEKNAGARKPRAALRLTAQGVQF
jgi:hypothetical protein